MSALSINWSRSSDKNKNRQEHCRRSRYHNRKIEALETIVNNIYIRKSSVTAMACPVLNYSSGYISSLE